VKAVLLSLVTSLAAAQAPGDSSGVCVGDLFLRADPTAPTTDGPDFTVQHFRTSRGPVGAYVGCCSQVHDAKRSQFTRVERLDVFRASEGDAFEGYLIETVHRINNTDWHTQYHFFGEGFADGAVDRSFFERLSVVEGIAHRCGRNAAT
jgi:hypothetical protein